MSRPSSSAVHFVGFRGDEYNSAVKVWGKPGFIHIRWDRRALREIQPGDTVVFATCKPLSKYNGPDIIEEGYF